MSVAPVLHELNMWFYSLCSMAGRCIVNHVGLHWCIRNLLGFLQAFERETHREKILEGRRREIKLKAKQASAGAGAGAGGGGGGGG